MSPGESPRQSVFLETVAVTCLCHANCTEVELVVGTHGQVLYRCPHAPEDQTTVLVSLATPPEERPSDACLTLLPCCRATCAPPPHPSRAQTLAANQDFSGHSGVRRPSVPPVANGGEQANGASILGQRPLGGRDRVGGYIAVNGGRRGGKRGFWMCFGYRAFTIGSANKRRDGSSIVRRFVFSSVA